MSACPWFVSARSKFSKARIPKEVRAEAVGQLVAHDLIKCTYVKEFATLIYNVN